MNNWQDISTAPRDGTVFEIMTFRGAKFRARYEAIGFLDDKERDVGTWIAAVEGAHPPCWTDGAFWKSNEAGIQSDRPVKWRPAPLNNDHEDDCA